MTDRDRLTRLYENSLPESIEVWQSKYTKEAVDYLLANGVIAPPCKVGDKVWFLLEDDFPVHKWFLSEETITEVATKGIFTSSFAEPCGVEDFGNYTAYTEIGTEAFLAKEEAEQALKERKSNVES